MVYTSKYPTKDFPADRSIFDILFNNELDVSSNKTVYIDIENEDKRLTYGQLKIQILKCAAGLKREFNFQYGDVVAICSPNHVDYPVVLHGTVAAGGVLAAIDQSFTPEKIALDLDLVRAKILVTHKEKVADVLSAAKIAGIPASNVLVFGDIEYNGALSIDETILSGDELAEPYQYTPEQLKNDPAYLYFTSGTTGRKKAVMLTQFMLSNSMLLTEGWLSPSSNILAYTEFHHSSSLVMVLHYSIYFGLTTYILPHYTLRKLCQSIQDYKINMTAAQPYVISSMVKDPIAKEYDLSSLKGVISCGAALDNSVTISAHEGLGINIINAYGMTEVIGIFRTTPALTLANSLGYLGVGFTAKLVDEEGREVPTGQMGELWVKGPTVTPGYYNMPESTADAIDSDGYLYTGDLVKCDEEGLFYYVDRSKDLIKYRLVHIYPSEIENVLMTHPKVADCAAIGVYYPEFVTELPRAFVHLVDGEKSSPEIREELQEYVDSRLPDAKRVRGGVVIIQNFPRTASGKIQRRILRQDAKAGIQI